jgi:hypothetical protein
MFLKDVIASGETDRNITFDETPEDSTRTSQHSERKILYWQAQEDERVHSFTAL